MLQNQEIRIHPPLNAVLSATLLGRVQAVRRDIPAGDAFLPADFGEIVDGLLHVHLLRLIGKFLAEVLAVGLGELGDVDVGSDGIHFDFFS